MAYGKFAVSIGEYTLAVSENRSPGRYIWIKSRVCHRRRSTGFYHRYGGQAQKGDFGPGLAVIRKARHDIVNLTVRQQDAVLPQQAFLHGGGLITKIPEISKIPGI